MPPATGGQAQLYVSRKTNTSNSIFIPRKKSAATLRQNQNAAALAAASDGADSSQTIKHNMHQESVMPLFDDSLPSLWKAVTPGTPDTQVQSRDEYEVEAEIRRKRVIEEAKRRKQRQRNEGGAEQAQNTDEQHLTWTQIQRNEENGQRTSGREHQIRAPTALMSNNKPVGDSPLFVQETPASSPEEGEIIDCVASTSDTFGREDLATLREHHDNPEMQEAEVIRVQESSREAASTPQRLTSRTRRSVEYISSDDSDSPIEPDDGVPAFRHDNSLAEHRAKQTKQSTQVERGAAAMPMLVSDIVASSDTGTETQRFQAQVDKINAMQDEADPDYDVDEIVEVDDVWQAIVEPCHRTQTRSKHDCDVDIPMLESNVMMDAIPISATKRPAKEPSPEAPSTKKKKRSEGPRPADAGWRFEKLKPRSKQLRENLIDEMQGEWNCAVETVVAEEIRPRWLDGAAVGQPKVALEWSFDLLEALRNLSLQTAGRPELASQVLRQSVTQQLAKHGGKPYLCKEDVNFAMQRLQKSQAATGEPPISPDLNTRTSQLSLNDRSATLRSPTRGSIGHGAVAGVQQSIRLDPGSDETPSRRQMQDDTDMSEETDADFSLAEVLQRERRNVGVSTIGRSQKDLQDEPPTASIGEEEKARKLAILEYEEARARRKLVQADLDEILTRKKLLGWGIDPDTI